MSIKKKNISVLILVLIFLVFISYKIYDINTKKDIARNYLKDEYKIDEEIQLEKFKIKVISAKLGSVIFDDKYKENKRNLDVLLNIKVTSNDKIDFNELICNIFTQVNKNSIPTEYMFSNSLEKLNIKDATTIKFIDAHGFENSDSINNLKKGDSIYVTLKWIYQDDFLKPYLNKNNKYVEVYFNKELYLNETIEKYKQGYMYIKYVKVPLEASL